MRLPTTSHPRVALTVGDPRGVGPEVVRKVLTNPPEPAEYVVVGPASAVRDLDAAQVIAGSWDPRTDDAAAAGRAVAAQVERAAGLALAGDVQAVVTAPAEKHALHLAGIDYAGHTEWLASLAGGVDVAMMLVADHLRVVLATTHIPLRQVPGALTVERITRVGALTVAALGQWWGISEPRVALCAVNPHAGERGLFGSEDDEILAPAARALGAVGPLPADTVFVRALRGEFDAVIAPYHDVGMTAVKVAAFGRAVNVTLGLPFVRTAPDHGTALDIAGRELADPGSMREAVRLAVRLARQGAVSRA